MKKKLIIGGAVTALIGAVAYVIYKVFCEECDYNDDFEDDFFDDDDDDEVESFE